MADLVRERFCVMDDSDDKQTVYVTCVTPSHIVTRSELVYVDVDVCSDYILYIYFRLRLLGHAMRLQPAFKKQPGGTFSPDNAPDRAPVVSVLLAPDQPIRQIVDMSASNAPRVFPSHGVTESITVSSHLNVECCKCGCKTRLHYGPVSNSMESLISDKLHYWGQSCCCLLYRTRLDRVSQKARHSLLCHRISPLTWIRLQQASQNFFLSSDKWQGGLLPRASMPAKSHKVLDKRDQSSKTNSARLYQGKQKKKKNNLKEGERKPITEKLESKLETRNNLPSSQSIHEK
ncbi:hypothetical protein YC2023_042814 [Brassica napus]